jgi:hypothetical protein
MAISYGAQSPSGIPNTNNSVQSITRAGQYEPFELQLARGQIAGHTPVYIFGYSNTVGNTALGPLWEGLTPSGGTYVYPSSAAQFTIVSTSSSDTSALSVQINGLDANYNQISEVIALNGTSNVTSVNSYLRINSAVVTNGTNVGSISFKQGSTLYAQINAGVGQTEMSIYTVPAGYTFYLLRAQAYANIGFTSSTYLTYTEYNKPNSGPYTGQVTLDAQSTFVQNLVIDYQDMPFPHQEKMDLQFEFKASTGTNTIASVYVLGYLIANNVV